MIHLTETGYSAGNLYCYADRRTVLASGDTLQHGVYAPLHNPEFRRDCCKACLRVWALEAYDDGDEMPDWVKLERSVKEA